MQTLAIKREKKIEKRLNQDNNNNHRKINKISIKKHSIIL